MSAPLSHGHIGATLLPQAPEHWAQAQGISIKELKTADYQTLLLFSLAKPFLEKLSPPLSDQAGIHLAVGPARTDLQEILRWSSRRKEGEVLPMVKPAQAISLLPNSPLSWLSKHLHLTGEGFVWVGLISGGLQALAAANEAIIDAPEPMEALVLAANCPSNYFVQDSFVRAGHTLPALTADTVCILRIRPLSAKSASPPEPKNAQSSQTGVCDNASMNLSAHDPVYGLVRAWECLPPGDNPSAWLQECLQSSSSSPEEQDFLQLQLDNGQPSDDFLPFHPLTCAGPAALHEAARVALHQQKPCFLKIVDESMHTWVFWVSLPWAKPSIPNCPRTGLVSPTEQQ